MKSQTIGSLAFVALCALGLVAITGGAAHDGEIRAFKRGSWQSIREAHAEKATVVHFWGLTCGPCRVEMPIWGKLLQERSDLDLVVINADLIPNETAAALEMLAKAGLASAENWIFADLFTERLRFEIDPQWQGEIPRTMLLARDGTTTLIEGAADPARIREWLDDQRR
jgi:thiol-disulfide isomerase/thioredoxin